MLCTVQQESKAKMWALREVQSLICSYLHQSFIADPPLCKLVHFQVGMLNIICELIISKYLVLIDDTNALFQGYPPELLPVTVIGIPSMHICVDFIAELISQPSLEKQEFAVNLISHLALQYALPHSMMVARLALNTFSSLLTGNISNS